MHADHSTPGAWLYGRHSPHNVTSEASFWVYLAIFWPRLPGRAMHVQCELCSSIRRTSSRHTVQTGPSMRPAVLAALLAATE